MLKNVIFILFVLFILSCNSSRSLNLGTFNKTKWLTSSNYRYKIVKSKDFPQLEGKSKDEIKEILGEPNFISEKAYTYCLDVSDENPNISSCKGSQVVILTDQTIPEKYKITIVIKEPIIKNN